VEVQMLDTRGPKTHKFGGHPPPPVSAWIEKGWQVISQFEHPVESPGEPLPEWCDSPESACIRPLVEKETGKGDYH
jgi:hypothetical protein